MRRLSLFALCFFAGLGLANAQEKATDSKAKKATTKTVTTKTTKTTKGLKTVVKNTTPLPPPLPPGPTAPVIPVPMGPDNPPRPIDPNAAPPPPMPRVQDPLHPQPGGPLANRPGGMKRGHPHSPMGGAGLQNQQLPTPPPGGQAPPRPYDPTVDNVPVGPNAGVFKFKEETHDFGTFEEGPTMETDFEFTNTGKEPITIKEAHASCGCTVPTPPKEPIYPGKTAKIHVTFNSKGRVGVIHKDITVVSNAKQQPMMLHLAGEVKPAGNTNTTTPAPADGHAH